MSGTYVKVTAGLSTVRLIGRLDPEQDPIALDWTGSGAEVQFRGSNLWAELEATAPSPIFWMIVLADGCPIGRFPVEPGVRFYPLTLGMEPERTRMITLMKETQCMPDAPEATVLLRSLRYEGTLEEPVPRKRKIEFIGDSLTSGEGALAPRGNEEWITPWFSARGNYSWYACEMLDAERSVLSQSGWGVNWDWQHEEAHTLSGGYELTVGVLQGDAAEKRGCRKPWNFAAWQPDCVCIRLMTNDNNGMNQMDSFPADRERAIQGCVDLLRKVRRCNPQALIVWILPGSDCRPEMAREAVERVQREGEERATIFTLPDYGEADLGARGHPNAEWNRKAGELLGAFLSDSLGKNGEKAFEGR